MGDRVPAVLTVEEAGALLRIGRTKAYAMAREWRDTGGRSGLPVIDLGHVLRVPRRALEELLGGDLADDANGLVDDPDEPEPPQSPAVEASAAKSSNRSGPGARRRTPTQFDSSRQLNLLNDAEAQPS
ncbi:MAG: helix-turn-helix domain-containing protein [Acidimicrobiales bacterium]